jgi:hypothetical protein
VANSHVSYLQTLAKDEAIAFVSSLQKVKEHLSHELQWINGQVQQKTIQLEGIDTLLSEAVGLGLLAPNAVSTVATELEQASSPAALAATNGNSVTVEATTPTDAIAGTPSESTLTASAPPPKRGKQRQADNISSSKRKAKLPATGKPGAAKTTSKATATKARKPGRPPQAASDSGKATDYGFQQFLQASFQDQSMTDAVGAILAATKEPLNTDAIMAQLYAGLSGEPYQRAKSSLSNILSVGKTKGKWKSPGRGLYIGS